jgi:ABC-type iron transport system FetAB permease component
MDVARDECVAVMGASGAGKSLLLRRIAGMDPVEAVEAVKYQILLMFLLCGASMLAAMGTAYMAMRSLTDSPGRLRLDRLPH